jgi:hypothetical protein
MRAILEIVVPLLLPTMLYLLYVAAARRRAAAAPGQAGWWREVPWTWLVISGALLVLVSLLAASLFGGALPGSHYEPARLENGVIEPGHLGN